MRNNFLIEDIIRDIQPSVVLLCSKNGTGTGFVINSSGYILTCNHVVQTDNVEIISSYHFKNEVSILAREKIYDLAMLKCPDLTIPPMVFANPISIHAGQQVYTLGYPLGLDYTASQGIVSNSCQEINGVNFIQTDVAINPGNSGSPLFNERGEVLGMINSKLSIENAQRLGFAIALRYIFAFAAQLRVKLTLAD